VYQVAGAINAQFGSFDAVPVHFLHQRFTFQELVPVYALADVGLITSLRESLSFTAYEFILCQQSTNRGVLILSEFSGSAQSLGAAAICVNPWDTNGFAAAIHDAVIMNDEEKSKRHEYAYNYVMKHTAHRWGERLLDEFKEAISEMEMSSLHIPPLLSHDEVLRAFFHPAIKQRIIVLGFRGTLFPSKLGGGDVYAAEIFGHVRLSALNQQSLSVLAQDPRNVIIIASSSCRSIMDKALGTLKDRVWMMAENGHCVKAIGDSWKWEKDDLDLSWKEAVKDILKYFVQRTPGSVTYETETSVSWVYQNTQRDHGAIQARDLLIHLWAGPLVASGADVVVGTQSVEVRHGEVSKASALDKILATIIPSESSVLPSERLFLCIGNFLMRDEDVFTTIHKYASGLETPASEGPKSTTASSHFCATVGRKNSRAQYHAFDAQDVGFLLAKLSHRQAAADNKGARH